MIFPTPKNPMGTEGRAHRPHPRLRLGPPGAPRNGDGFSHFFAPFTALFSLATRRRTLEHRPPTTDHGQMGGGWASTGSLNVPRRAFFLRKLPIGPRPGLFVPLTTYMTTNSLFVPLTTYMTTNSLFVP